MDKAEVEIFGPVSKITGTYPVKAIRDATSYEVEGAQFSPSYRKGLWDGRKHLFKVAAGSFPTGLLDEVLKVCEIANVEVTVTDHRVVPKPEGRTYDLAGVKMAGKYAYQLKAAKAAVKQRQGILRIATNGGKTEIACAITKYLGLKTLFMVTTRELLYQARERFMKRLEVDETQIGVIGDGHWEPGEWVTIATVDTLESRINTQECQDLLKETQVLFADECHHLGSETWYTICTICAASYRYGLSGTPLDRTDGANLRLLAGIGPVIVDIPNKQLVDAGISARAHIIFSQVTSPILNKKLPYPSAYKQGVVENEVLLKEVIEWTKVLQEAGLSTLILTEEIAHGKRLDEALWNETDGVFIPHQYIYGDETTEVRGQALKAFADRKLPVLIASTILDEGVDVPTIDALILAGSRKSRIKTMQRLGRGLRGDKLIVIEFANFCHDYLLKHSLERYEDYKKEECFPLYQSGPDIQLVKKLWK